ncbi:flagellar biosynthesis protein FlhF [Frateuria sp. STR12]|uniref:flagellar biosynthesis protein FlhF n=1 Tax=Frateuria hangzhouensis TaxID=2995589 RepID=UPI002260B159|nr:flagellar biosynthesis protein FlhF [Frateuria sp. STR12]MCX7513155.1 flagellar biosynthesis protein FlhF [Frateuria sp. STR12]
MKIKRFVAPDMRQAMREVREEQGPDAVILSTRRVDEGIEIIAAVDYDEALVREAARHGAAPAPAAMPPLPVQAAGSSAPPPPPPPLREVRVETLTPANRSTPIEHTPKASPPAAPEERSPRQPALRRSPLVGDALDVTADAAAPAPQVDEPTPVHPLIERAAQDTVRMRAELSSLREMLEMQLSSLAWNDMERRQPLHARVLRELTRLGIDADVARALADQLPAQMTAEQARYLPLGMLSRGLAVSGRGRSDEGGVTALVGPTGVGKTTTLAKLAARAVVRHGASQVALVSTDHYRIGAAAQLEHYARLLGVRVYPAYDAQSLRQVLELLKGCHTVLVDTAGLAGNDPRLKEQLDVLGDAGDLRACLVLAANAQAQSLEDAVRAYLPLKPHAAILTKLDEAPSLGGALSVLIRHRLALDYTTDGQRVPEDIAAADARLLVCRAAQALKGSAPVADEVLLAERFGAMVAQA